MRSSQSNKYILNNTFSIAVEAKQLYQPKCLDDLVNLPDLNNIPFYILGEGSNTLFTDNESPLIIRPLFTGIEVKETSTHYLIKVGASENWNNFIHYCVKHKMYGLENLALIPGSTGAAPVQNIGAYGVEFADFCENVHWFDFNSKTLNVLTREQCKFSYRESIFKQALYNKGVITHVTLKLAKEWQPNLSYQGLEHLTEFSTAEQVMTSVISLRQRKLPDPAVLPNAGSFFKNPVITADKLKSLLVLYPLIPNYPQNNGDIKIAAGWLIDQAGLKGYRIDNVGVHAKQALVLVNYGKSNGKQVVQLARYVQQCIKDKFDITLEPEVKMVTNEGEVKFEELAF